MTSLVIDNLTIPTEGCTPVVQMLCASNYYSEYVRKGGTMHYQEYIQWVERHLDPSKELLAQFMKEYFSVFVVTAGWSNEHWS